MTIVGLLDEETLYRASVIWRDYLERDWDRDRRRVVDDWSPDLQPRAEAGWIAHVEHANQSLREYLQDRAARAPWKANR